MQTIKVIPSGIVGVTAAVIIHNGRVLIARRNQTDHLAGYWEFPGGKLETGESPRDGLKRELKEELGIETRIGSFLGESVHRYPHFSIKLLVYRAFWESGDLVVNDHAGIDWVLPEDLNQYEFAPADKPFVRLLTDGAILNNSA